MAKGEHYLYRALTGGTVSAFGTAILVPVAVITGQLLVVGFMHLFGSTEVDDVKSFFTLIAVSFCFGMMSGLGLILFVIELWFLVKLLHDEFAPVDYFFLVAASQVGLYICATLFLGTYVETWYVGPLSLLVLGLLWWGTVMLRRRAEAADIERMKEEGKEYREELRDRHERQRGLRRFRN
jgi:signal transduction histidine kinase